MRHALYIIVLFLFGCISAQGQGGDAERLFAYFKTLSGFDNQYPREKVYLHTDNDAYMEGETLWFKAYVVRASTLRPEPVSKVLYVELLDDCGRISQRRLLRLDSLGRAEGDIALELPVRAGYYELRAYTREMVNWGEEACFSRVIPVFGENDSAARQVDIPPVADGTDPERRTLRPQLRPQKSGKRIVSFFPEGGNRIAGAAQRVAFKITDGRGRAASDTLLLIDANGQAVAAAAPLHDGMGLLSLPADAEGWKVRVGKDEYDLPAPEPEGRYVLEAQPDGEGVNLLITRTPQSAITAEERLLGLAVMCRERVCYFDTLSIGRGEAVEMYLPNASLHGGVNRIELFDLAGKSLCRRLVWRQAEERQLVLTVRQNEEQYEAFAPVALELELKDAQGRPVPQADFSLSVRDAESELPQGAAASLAEDMLLSSEVKGYVHWPRYYFEQPGDPVRRAALDLLLMVQGWSATDFEQMCGSKDFFPEQPIEERLTLNGRVLRDNNKQQPYANMELDIKMYSMQGAALEGTAVTDSEGRFAFTSNADYTGDWTAVFTVRNEDGKKKWARLAIDRWFMPPARAIAPTETDIALPLPANEAKHIGGRKIETFEWEDTIPRHLVQNLGEAVVTHKGQYRGFTGGRYTYRGGEKAGMRNATVFYDIASEVERYKDAGHWPNYFMEFFAYVDGNVTPDRDFDASLSAPAASREIGIAAEKAAGAEAASASLNSDNNSVAAIGDNRLRFRGRVAKVVFNNHDNFFTNPALEDLLAEEVKSVAIISKEARMANMGLSGGEDYDYLINIYLDPQFARFKARKGVETRRVQGYTQPRKFFSPNYNGLELPTDADRRRTLFWCPSVKTDAAGRASAVFFNNARSGTRLHITARGIAGTGQLVDFER